MRSARNVRASGVDGLDQEIADRFELGEEAVVAGVRADHVKAVDAAAEFARDLFLLIDRVQPIGVDA